MRKTAEYRKELLREMKTLRAGQTSVNQAKAMAALGNAITQSIIAEAQVIRLQETNKNLHRLGDLEICNSDISED